jgi:hypothetical protein
MRWMFGKLACRAERMVRSAPFPPPPPPSRPPSLPPSLPPLPSDGAAGTQRLRQAPIHLLPRLPPFLPPSLPLPLLRAST